MKIKSFVLGSIAAVGFSGASVAADLGTVLTSLDTCDALGISGLTLSSDTNCLRISGGVKYQFTWGDYDGAWGVGGVFDIPDDDGLYDWNSDLSAWLKFVGTAESSFGPASATIKFGYKDNYAIISQATPVPGDSNGLTIDEAYVSIGDTTVLMAGRKGSIANFDNDKPLNWLGLFNGDIQTVLVGVDRGIVTGGHVIQVTSDLGNGISVGGALEALNETGTAVGVLAYDGEGIAAHVTVLADTVLTGSVTNWGVHAGFTGTFDMFKIGAAFAADSANDWDGMVTASATYDMFTLAASGQFGSASGINNAGAGLSASAEVSDGVTINAGFRWFDPDTSVSNDEGWQAAAQLVAAVTETITLTGEIGVYSNTAVAPVSNAYGKAEIAWAPGGGFTSSLGGEYYATGAYRVTFKAAKDFE